MTLLTVGIVADSTVSDNLHDFDIAYNRVIFFIVLFICSHHLSNTLTGSWDGSS